ncbi:hypothetical protein JB92DRAFT_3109767 [Gautieria morchelliformis]|nr:hypothetical protein JB92DRAFT_3109767 [Gautieria morchelliformis]
MSQHNQWMRWVLGALGLLLYMGSLGALVKITTTKKVTDPSNASVPALASHHAAASAATAKRLAVAKLPSAPSSESIDKSAVEESSGTPQIGDTADPTGTENVLGGEGAKELPGIHTSAHFDEGRKTSNSTGSSKTQHKRKQGHTMKRHTAADPTDVDASSVSSEHAFLSAGITVSKCRSRLKGVVVEALQCFKCLLRHDFISRKPEPWTTTEMAL